LDRHDFGGVRDRHGLESTPRETKEEITDEEHGQVGGEELDEEETGQANEGGEHGGSVTVSLRSPTGDLETQDLTDGGRNTETTLPFGGDFVLVTGGRVDTESLGEGLVGKELTKE